MSETPIVEAPPFCCAQHPLTDAFCRLWQGHAGDHWGHGLYRMWPQASPTDSCAASPASESEPNRVAPSDGEVSGQSTDGTNSPDLLPREIAL